MTPVIVERVSVLNAPDNVRINVSMHLVPAHHIDDWDKPRPRQDRRSRVRLDTRDRSIEPIAITAGPASHVVNSLPNRNIHTLAMVSCVAGGICIDDPAIGQLLVRTHRLDLFGCSIGKFLWSRCSRIQELQITMHKRAVESLDSLGKCHPGLKLLSLVGPFNDIEVDLGHLGDMLKACAWMRRIEIHGDLQIWTAMMLCSNLESMTGVESLSVVIRNEACKCELDASIHEVIQSIFTTFTA